MNCKIGCISLVPVEGGFLAIECAKGRGTILPGGKLDKNETLQECAARELWEETSFCAQQQRLLFQAHNANTGYYVYCFLTYLDLYDYPKINNKDLPSTKEGKVVVANWDTLLKSQFRGYYELLRDKYNNP